ncbi:hypothetical protein EVAR_60853_1 [Eumeta japonica]|uniref:Uncharacterized protein n=1 Tax=Eumeta variegata TaxID=151549 RepID=A0A4C1Y9S9_EUMVA|nr:hypothetical protein EVAR_60853_1 [Eumeta japonica]
MGERTAKEAGDAKRWHHRVTHRAFRQWRSCVYKHCEREQRWRNAGSTKRDTILKQALTALYKGKVGDVDFKGRRPSTSPRAIVGPPALIKYERGLVCKNRLDCA